MAPEGSNSLQRRKPRRPANTYLIVLLDTITAASALSMLRQFGILLIAVSILCGGHLAESAAAQYDVGIVATELPQHDDGDHSSRGGHVATHSCHGTCHLFPSSLIRVVFSSQIDSKLTPSLLVSFQNRHPQGLIRPPIGLLA